MLGSTIGNYVVRRKIGEGGMGIVYLAEHPRIGRKVAIKVLLPQLSQNPEIVARFFTEARSITQIQNEHIVDVQNFGQTPDGDNFIIMEFLDGYSLGDKIKSEHILPLEKAKDWR